MRIGKRFLIAGKVMAAFVVFALLIGFLSGCEAKDQDTSSSEHEKGETEAEEDTSSPQLEPTDNQELEEEDTVEEQLRKHYLVNLLGTKIGDIYKEYGRPRNMEGFQGAYFHDYLDTASILFFSPFPEESEPVSLLWYFGDEEILGVRVGMTFVEIQKILGEPDFDASTMPYYGVVNTAVLRLRSGPGTNYDTLKNLKEDTELQVIGSQGEWFEVITPEGEKGWVHGDYVILYEDSEGFGPTHYIQYAFANVIDVDIEGYRHDLLVLTFEGDHPDSSVSTIVLAARSRQ